MKTREWIKEMRAWVVSVALLAIVVLAFVYIPGYLKRLETERQEREALMKTLRDTPPAERIEQLKKAAKEQAAKEQAAREGDNK